jgi:hypothetical protein
MVHSVNSKNSKCLSVFCLPSKVCQASSLRRSALDQYGVSCNKFIQSKSRLGFSALIVGVCLLVAAKNVSGQEALRISMAGDLAAESQHQADSSIGYYNLLLGPTAWRFSSGLNLEYDDNVRLEQNGESDLIFQPSLNTQMHWPLTLKNSLDFSLGVGYSEYLQHQDLSQFFINPGSGFSFDVYVGDFKINLHDRITITENTYQNPGASGGNQNLVDLENTVGVGWLWDLNKIIVNSGYDHVNYVHLQSEAGQQPDAASENIYINSGVRVRPELIMGLEAGGTVISYSQENSSNSPTIPSAVQWNVGAFVSSQISEYLNTRLDVGYSDYAPDATSTNLFTSDSSGFYLSFSLSHRVNRFVNYTLTAGRSTDLSAYGEAQTYYFASLTPNWNFFKNYSVSTPISWRNGTTVYNITDSSRAKYNQIQLGLNVGRNLTKKLSTGISYQFVRETSNFASNSYIINIVSLNFNYQF